MTKTRTAAEPNVAAEGPMAWPAVTLAPSLALAVTAALTLAGIGCTADTSAARQETASGAAHSVATHDAHAGHDHDGTSDLDRSVSDLLAQHCEHEMAAYRCDECRYEVGVAKVGQELIDGGLVAVTRARTQAMAAEVELSGEIRFDERRVVHLGPRAPGTIRRAVVDLGQAVAVGDLLVELDSRELGEAQATYLEARAALQVAERALARHNELWAAQITSEREHLEAVREHDEARIRVEAARQALARYGLTDTEIAALEREGLAAATGVLRLRAPLAGEVLALHAVRGEQAEAGAEIVEIGDTSTLWVWVDLYEDQLAAFRGVPIEGAPASVSVRAHPGEHFAGRLDFVAQVMDTATRTVKARVTVPNPGGELRPGMFARVRLAAGPATETLAVPTAAVLSDEGRDFVFVHCTEDYYVRRPIVPGRRDGGYVEVASGLVSGQPVVTAGAFLLKSDVLREKMGEGCAH